MIINNDEDIYWIAIRIKWDFHEKKLISRRDVVGELIYGPSIHYDIRRKTENLLNVDNVS